MIPGPAHYFLASHEAIRFMSYVQWPEPEPEPEQQQPSSCQLAVRMKPVLKENQPPPKGGHGRGAHGGRASGGASGRPVQ